MLKAVKVFASQQMPNYRKPTSFVIRESYPLPPYSSVIGLTHTLCGWVGENSGYRPMKVSVQGSHAATVSDYVTLYAFGTAYDPARRHLKVELENGKADGVSRMPKNCELLTDVELLLHIIPEDQSLVEEIAAAFDKPPVYPSLGRHEDILRIDRVEIVELEPVEDGITARYDAYLPESSIDEEYSENLTGTSYRLNKVFVYEGKKNMRVWKESVRAKHICAGVSVIPKCEVYIDSGGDAVLPA